MTIYWRVCKHAGEFQVFTKEGWYGRWMDEFYVFETWKPRCPNTCDAAVAFAKERADVLVQEARRRRERKVEAKGRVRV